MMGEFFSFTLFSFLLLCRWFAAIYFWIKRHPFDHWKLQYPLMKSSDGKHRPIFYYTEQWLLSCSLQPWAPSPHGSPNSSGRLSGSIWLGRNTWVQNDDGSHGCCRMAFMANLHTFHFTHKPKKVITYCLESWSSTVEVWSRPIRKYVHPYCRGDFHIPYHRETTGVVWPLWPDRTW